VYLPLSKAWEVCYYASKVTDKYLEVNGLFTHSCASCLHMLTCLEVTSLNLTYSSALGMRMVGH
jgi:hypothetical protein